MGVIVATINDFSDDLCVFLEKQLGRKVAVYCWIGFKLMRVGSQVMGDILDRLVETYIAELVGKKNKGDER